MLKWYKNILIPHCRSTEINAETGEFVPTKEINAETKANATITSHLTTPDKMVESQEIRIRESKEFLAGETSKQREYQRNAH
jgi:hypothetical protein